MRTIPIIILASMLPLFALDWDLTPGNDSTTTVPRACYGRFGLEETHTQHPAVKLAIDQGPFILVRRAHDTAEVRWTLDGRFRHDKNGEYTPSSKMKIPSWLSTYVMSCKSLLGFEDAINDVE